ncbi:Annexin [Thermothelomyces heterothallicus CBS 203.75]
MSLQVDDGSRRGRSRSPGRRGADEDGERDRSRTRASLNVVEVPYPGSTDSLRGPPASAAYEYERLSRWPPGPDAAAGYYPPPPRGKPADDRDDPYAQARREVEYGYERDGRRDRESDSDRDRGRQRPDLYLPPKYAAKIVTVEPGSPPRQSRDSLPAGKDRESEKERERRRKKEKLEEDLAYGKLPGPSKYEAPPSPRPESYGYAQPKPWEYAKPPEEPRYNATHLDVQGPAGGPGRSPSPGPPSPIKSAMKRDRSRSPMPPTARMSTLSVDTPRPAAGLSVSAAPASPLLEAYHGTWQSLSPMPSPMPPPTADPQILEALSPIASDDERAGDKRRARRARFNDPADDAARLAKALKGERRAPDTEPLIEILPGLTHEQVMELRAEYKRIVKTGAERKGVNIAKHIRARLKDEDPNLMKVCYATALGRWESEAYWANFWYHGDKTRRELLIEALMGRTNDEIRRIKEGFRDKKYANSLTKCMRTELKEDKFKKAVLMVLDEQRMEEVDAYGRPLRIDYDLVDDDVRQLHHAVRSEKGGESLMISIVTQRSDAHLREVLREYKDKYRGANFAKDALKKSGNLVGEVLAHILNGVINKPMRDAMLLHHALTASRRDELRRELLISRLVRYHWDAQHMALVKRAYREHYGRELQDAVREATRGEWGEFCVALCIVRMPDDVRQVERVDIHR